MNAGWILWALIVAVLAFVSFRPVQAFAMYNATPNRDVVSLARFGLTIWLGLTVALTALRMYYGG
jgi:hypothetical protein